MSEISICIGNYGAYNDGYLIDRWVDLPMDQEDLDAVLDDMQAQAEELTGCPCEEFYVSDYDGMPFGFAHGRIFGEHTPLNQLNILAMLMEQMPDECGIVQDVLDTGVEAPDDIVGLMNWILQADELPYRTYDCPEYVDSPTEKIGYTFLACEPWFATMMQEGVESYFDVEAYGDDVANDLYLGDDGYVDAACDWPDEDVYSLEDISFMVCR